MQVFATPIIGVCVSNDDFDNMSDDVSDKIIEKLESELDKFVERMPEELEGVRLFLQWHIDT